jgi:1-acyl-sn-glycerol-3-phosphate acyltransferase
VPLLPIMSTFFSRTGAIGGTRENFRKVLDAGELLLVFPEGTEGIGKPFSKRYELQSWRVGHAELAIRHQVPVVPVAVIGAEEQWPQIARLDRVKLFGAPFLPVPATPLPLPVHYHIYYGEPLALHEGLDPFAADDPAVVTAAALRVRDAVAALIERGLAERPGVFR